MEKLITDLQFLLTLCHISRRQLLRSKPLTQVEYSFPLVSAWNSLNHTSRLKIASFLFEFFRFSSFNMFYWYFIVILEHLIVSFHSGYLLLEELLFLVLQFYSLLIIEELLFLLVPYFRYFHQALESPVKGCENCCWYLVDVDGSLQVGCRTSSLTETYLRRTECVHDYYSLRVLLAFSDLVYFSSLSNWHFEEYSQLCLRASRRPSCMKVDPFFIFLTLKS